MSFSSNKYSNLATSDDEECLTEVKNKKKSKKKKSRKERRSDKQRRGERNSSTQGGRDETCW